MAGFIQGVVFCSEAGTATAAQLVEGGTAHPFQREQQRRLRGRDFQIDQAHQSDGKTLIFCDVVHGRFLPSSSLFRSCCPFQVHVEGRGYRHVHPRDDVLVHFRGRARTGSVPHESSYICGIVFKGNVVRR